MLIGELAERTGASERQLRYYEHAGLLTPQRQANGYRDYDRTAEQTVRQIRALLAAGLSTRLVRQVLPCALDEGSLRPCPGVLEKLRTQLVRLDHRATDLAQARETLREVIRTAEDAEARQPRPKLRQPTTPDV
ncbi:MerR family transcriptional regulator [Nocardia sp. NPDC004168]|uniref:MerR family transcriptional regulator n=1 Tax=Nocardia TaxID=1817 RepID=UPI0033B5035D